MRRLMLLLVLLSLVAGCGPEPTQTPDLVATEVAVQRAAASTLTAGVPVPSETPAPTSSPVPPEPSPTPKDTPPPPPPASTPPPTPTEAPPPVGPSLGRFAVVGVYSDDVLNVRQGPGVQESILGTIPYYGRSVDVRAGGKEVAGSWWVPVAYGGLSGWVNHSYLAQQVGDVGDAVAARAAEIVLALRDRDLDRLAGLSHPIKGLTFSPYTYVRPLQSAPGQADLVFSPAQLRGLWSDTTVYSWGIFDGSGEPIDMTFQDYYARFVYDVDFAQPDVIGFDQTVGQGNTINNIGDVYPLAVTVEYHFEGFDPQYAGLDWRSLRLVLEEVQGDWLLVGLVHDEWTI